MNFQGHLQSLMLHTATHFDNAVLKEPIIDSEEGDTVQDTALDEVLGSQETERELLWKELHKLEENQRTLENNNVFGGAAASDRKLLMILQYEENGLYREREEQELDIPRAPVANDDSISDIQFKERLQRSVMEMNELVSFLKDELTTGTAKYQNELRNVDECQQIQDALTKKIQEFETNGLRSVTQRNFERLLKARQDYQVIMESLVEFLEEHYPPHLSDNAALHDINPEHYCDLKHILEDLMNRSVLNPSNPYIELRDDAYWSPYIETLVKGNIATRHPENPKRLRLKDFRIH